MCSLYVHLSARKMFAVNKNSTAFKLEIVFCAIQYKAKRMV